MSNTFLIADTHFGHNGVCNFLRKDGTKLRPWTDPVTMDIDMVEFWNDTVRPKDKVYHLGDVVINRRALPTLKGLHGEKILIKGNHDLFRVDEYTPYFRNILAYAVMEDMILSHIPVHPHQQERFKANIHGHLHDEKLDDPWYLCVSVEHTNYRPISFSEVKQRLEKQNALSNN